MGLTGLNVTQVTTEGDSFTLSFHGESLPLPNSSIHDEYAGEAKRHIAPALLGPHAASSRKGTQAFDQVSRPCREVLLSTEHECCEGAALIALSGPADAIDAVGFGLHLQEALLEVPWPVEMLSNPHACRILSSDCKTLFKGLRVRLAMHTAVPASIQANLQMPRTLASDAQMHVHMHPVFDALPVAHGAKSPACIW